MFRNLLSRLLDDSASSGMLQRHDAEVAIAALLVRLARADDEYGKAAKKRIDELLALRGGLSTSDATELRAAAEMIEAEAPDTVRFTRQIKDKIVLAERIAVVEALWAVAYADGKKTASEEALVRLVSNLLGISDVESGLARQRVAHAAR